MADGRDDGRDLDSASSAMDLRPDSETLPSPPGSPSPVLARHRIDTRTRKKKRGKRARDSATSSSTSPRSAVHARDFDFLASPPALIDTHIYTDSSASPSTRNAAPRTPRRALFARSNPSTSPQSQHITALPPLMANAQLSPADRFHAAQPSPHRSRLLTEAYTAALLVLFAIWGTLARLGLQALTSYPGAPVVFSELWANVGGTFIMGFLAADTRLFRDEWGQSALEKRELDRAAHAKAKKTLPLYIGLTTGFCGSFTSFSSFARDVFLGLSNDLPAPLYHPSATPSSLVPRNPGYSVMALLGVILTTLALCLCALTAGAHLAAALESYTPTLPFPHTHRLAHPLLAALGLATWLAALVLTILPPHPSWRGTALFAAVVAPVGCLARHYISRALNPVSPSFPLGTFTCNILGTAVLGMAFDLQRVSLGGVVGGGVVACQVLRGLQDGFCGALTTVSSWVAELNGLGRRAAYVYGAVSVVGGLSVLTVVMGSVRWGVGWREGVCG